VAGLEQYLQRSVQYCAEANIASNSLSLVDRTPRIGRRHGVDWGGHVHLLLPEVVPKIDANPVSFY